MRQRAADGAAMANLGIAHMAGRMMQQGSGLAEQFTDLEIAVAGERTNGDVIAGITDEAQIVEAAHIDQHSGRREPEFHERQQGMATSKELGFIAVLGEQSDGVASGLGPHVVKRRGDHDAAPELSAAQASTDCTML